ncbi:MAG TPA: molybdenum cofactor biosynthesis protein MoaE [Candidatus Thermoplasmatota archaeon]|nr:molybdenum cofactor biosynthesis protein MoaE [Candidatus Thermoplasmatota archaeon]
MRVRVRFFAGTRDAVGAPALDVDVPEGARVADVVDAVCERHPPLARYRPHALYALDGAFVPTTQPVRAGAEVAMMPPVSGGDGRRLQEGAFSLAALVADLEKQGAGAVVAFVGYVRGDEGVSRLRFEAYGEMAEREIRALEEAARAKFSLTGVVVRHRVATLAVGEPIVAVVAAAPHRRDAFEAAAWLMDELKTRVPIWKAEEGPAGARWVNDPTR